MPLAMKEKYGRAIESFLVSIAPQYAINLGKIPQCPFHELRRPVAVSPSRLNINILFSSIALIA